MLKKFFSFSVGTWLGALVGFITIPFLTHFFPPDDLGKLSMFTLALSIMTVTTMFGVDQTFVRFYYEEKPSVLLSKSLILTFVIFIPILLLVFLFRENLSVYLFGIFSPELFFLLIVSIIVSVLNNYASQILRMEHKGISYSITQFGLRFFELSFIFLLLVFLKKDYHLLIWAKIMTLFVVTLYAFWAAKDVWKQFSFKVTGSKYSYKEIFHFSYPLAFSMLISWLIQGFDKIALNEWSSLYEIGIYTAAFRIVLVLQLIQTSFTTYWIPLAFERFLKNGNDNENRIFFSNANSAITAIMLIAAVGLIMTKDIIALLLGSEYKASVSMIPFLVLFPVMNTISESTVIGISFYKKVKIVALISILALVSCIILNTVFTRTLHGIGASISTGMSAVILFILRTHFSLKYYKVNYNLRKFYLFLFLLICFALYSTFVDWNFLNLIFGGVLISFIAFSYFPVISLLYRNLSFTNKQLF